MILQAQITKQKRIIENLTSQLQISIKRNIEIEAQRDNAWNDAIEKAAITANAYRADLVAARIRELKRK